MIFLGNVLGMLVFGYACDKSGRKYSLIVASIFLVVFSIMSAAAYYKGTNEGVINTLIIYRFLLGVGIGGGMQKRGVRELSQQSSLENNDILKLQRQKQFSRRRRTFFNIYDKNGILMVFFYRISSWIDNH